MIRASLVEHIKGRWREFLREPSAAFWVVFMPLLWMIVLGIAFSNPKPSTYGIGVVTQKSIETETLAVRKVHLALVANPQLRIFTGSPQFLDTLQTRGEISLKLAINENRGIAEEGISDVKYFFDPNNPEALASRQIVNDSIQRQAGRLDPLAVEDVPITANGQRYIDFLIPGLLGLSIMSSSLFGTGLTIVSNRKENLLKRYLATPMPKIDYLFSHVVGRLIILSVEFLTITLSGLLIFGFHVFGSILSYVFFCILGAASFTGISLFCACRSRNIAFMAGLVNLISIPSILLSGVFFSVSRYPDVMQSFLKFLPLNALIGALRGIALEAQPISALGFEAAVLVVYCAVSLGLARWLFKWF